MYEYSKMRNEVFKEENQETFLKIRDKAKKFLATSGAFRLSELISGMSGDTDLFLACVDRLLELREITEMTDKNTVRGQDRIFTYQLSADKDR